MINKRGKGKQRVSLSKKGYPRLSLTVTGTKADAEPLDACLGELVRHERVDLANAIHAKRFTLKQLAKALATDKTKRMDTISVEDVLAFVAGLPSGQGAKGVTVVNGAHEVPEELQLGFNVDFLLDRGLNADNEQLSPETIDRFGTSMVAWYRFLGAGDIEKGRKVSVKVLWSEDTLVAYMNARLHGQVVTGRKARPRKVSGQTTNRDQDAATWVRQCLSKHPTKKQLVLGLAEPRPPRAEEPGGRMRFLLPSELQRLDAYCLAERPQLNGKRRRNLRHYHVIFRTAIGAGPRIDELLERPIGAFHLEQGEPYVVLVGSTDEGYNGTRIVPITEELRALLRWWIGELEAMGYATGSHDRMFPGPYGRYQNVVKTWHAVRKAINLGDVRIHDLRHTFGVYLSKGGAAQPVIQRLLGHRTPQMSMRYVARAVTDEVVEAIQRAAVVAAGRTQSEAAVLADPAKSLRVLIGQVGAHHLRTILEKELGAVVGGGVEEVAVRQ